MILKCKLKLLIDRALPSSPLNTPERSESPFKAELLDAAINTLYNNSENKTI